MSNCKWWAISSALVLSSLSTAALGQVEPKSPVHITINGVFFLCPRLVRENGAFPSNELAALGFAVETEPRADGPWFKALSDKGLLMVSYDAREKRCILHYGGPGYEAIAGVVRDTVTQNRFRRITGGDQDGAKGDVFEGPISGTQKTARIIIIENYSQPSATISYAER